MNSLKEQKLNTQSLCELWFLLQKIENYEPGLIDLIINFITTIIKTNEELQLKINEYFSNFYYAYKKYGSISKWNVFYIKQINVIFPEDKNTIDYCGIHRWICRNKPIIKYRRIFYISHSNFFDFEYNHIYRFERFERFKIIPFKSKFINDDNVNVDNVEDTNTIFKKYRFNENYIKNKERKRKQIVDRNTRFLNKKFNIKSNKIQRGKQKLFKNNKN